MPDRITLCHPGFSEHLSSPNSLETPISILPNYTLQVRAVILDSIQYESGVFTPSTNTADVAQLWKNLPNSPGRYRQVFNPANCLGCVPRLAAFLSCLCASSHQGLWENWEHGVAAYIRRLQTAGAQFSKDDLGDIEEQSAIGDATIVESYVREIMRGRKFIVTSRGYFALTFDYPAIDFESDVCCIIYGARTPMVLRKTGKDGHYKLLGEVWIQGESGAAFGSPKDRPWLDWSVEEEDIFLV